MSRRDDRTQARTLFAIVLVVIMVLLMVDYISRSPSNEKTEAQPAGHPALHCVPSGCQQNSTRIPADAWPESLRDEEY